MQSEVDRVGDIVIEEIDLASVSDADVERLAGYFNLMRAESNPEDPEIPAHSLRAELENIPAFVVVRSFAARDSASAIVASAEVTWTNTEDNQHAARAGISVHPDHRRAGIGTAMLARVVEVTELAGRRLLTGTSSDRVPSGDVFAKRVGAEIGLVQHINRLAIDEVDRDMVERWIDEGPTRADGYSLVAVDGTYPDDLVDEIVDLHGVMNTAPRDDLDLEDSVFTVEQARELEKSNLATGLERWYLAARHDASGRLAGWTEVGWSPDTPQTVWQWGTGVRPEHRGHALGKWLKAVMLRRIMDDAPDVVDIRTGNADSNDAMLGINNMLGFKPYHSHVTWQLSLENAKSYLANV